ncbi:MAG: nicotinamide-nucleotide amidohydrolase family protein [Gemmataceae bacterium]
MYDEQVRPRLLALGLGGGVQVQRKINTFGGGESHIEEKLFDLTRRGHVPEVGITASDATISLRIFARAATRAECQAQIAPVEATIRDRLRHLVFGVDDEDLEDAVVALLAAKKLSLASAESVTAGRIGAKLTRVPGVSDWYRGGIIAYDNRIKVNVLGVPARLIDTHGVISAPVVEAMAVQCRKLFQTDIGVATVGLAGPGTGDSDKPVGLVYAAVAWDGGVKSSSFSWLGTREEIQGRTAKMALNMVRLYLLGR